MITVIVQARMGSTRLAGKVLKQISGRPMLSYQIERLSRSARAEQVVIATSRERIDDAIAEFCATEGVACARGSQHDVLARFGDAARQFGASTVVRVTGDCPLLDPQLVDAAIAAYVDTRDCDYVSNMLEPTWPYGMAVEVLGAATLFHAEANAHDPLEREHVTPFIYWRPEQYRLKSLTRSPDLSHHRWTVDTPEDFDMVSRIIAALYPVNPQFQMTDVLTLLGANPQWQNINRHVQQVAVHKP